jgi:hypothetical protein
MYSLIGPFFGGRPRPAIFTKTDEETPTPLANASVSPLSLSLFPRCQKNPVLMTREKRAKVLKNFCFFFFFLPQDCLNPMLESTNFFQRKGKKDTKEEEDFPLQTTIPFL